jgi:hypothetical protein
MLAQVKATEASWESVHDIHLRPVMDLEGLWNHLSTQHDSKEFRERPEM